MEIASICINIPNIEIKTKITDSPISLDESVWRDEYIREMARLQAQFDWKQAHSNDNQNFDSSLDNELGSPSPFNVPQITGYIDAGEWNVEKLCDYVVYNIKHGYATLDNVVDLIRDICTSYASRRVLETFSQAFSKENARSEMFTNVLRPIYSDEFLRTRLKNSIYDAECLLIKVKRQEKLDAIAEKLLHKDADAVLDE